MDRDPGEGPLERRPARAPVPAHVGAELRPHEEDVGMRGVLDDIAHGPAGRVVPALW